MWTVAEIAIRRLLHSMLEVAVLFVVPIVFFSVFALIFGSGVGRTPQVRTLIVDADATSLTAQILARLEDAPGLKATIFEIANYEGDLQAVATDAVRNGQYSAAVFLPELFSESVSDGSSPGSIRVLSDSSNKVAAQVVGALVEQAMQQVVGEHQARQHTRGITPPGLLAGGISGEGTLEPTKLSSSSENRPRVEVVDVLGEGKSNPLIAMSAAGIAVMFLLFSAAGAGGALLEEEESGTLERLLTSKLSVFDLLLGKWLYITVQGVVQVTLMFLWGAAVFDVQLFDHLPGFAVMTIASAAAASSFAVLLATICQTRSQLSGVSTILILTMSALGGSMVPRYIMSERLQEWGLLTFNAWALDGYNKVFWRDQPVHELGPQVAVLASSALIMFVVATLFGRRWSAS